MSDAVVLPRRQQVVFADLLPGALVRDILLVVSFAGFVGLLAQVSIPLSFTPVPLTGQTLGVLLGGTALGWKRGTLGMVLYGGAGVLGIPWFADHQSGYVGASFGYVIGFVLCAALCGFLAERGADRSLRLSLPAMIGGEIVMYFVGVAWLCIALNVSVGKGIALGLTPFLLGDAIKVALASFLLPGAWKLCRSRA